MRTENSKKIWGGTETFETCVYFFQVNRIRFGQVITISVNMEPYGKWAHRSIDLMGTVYRFVISLREAS